ncbi:acyl carrier protein [Deinococcus cellulosilyticus]|uniref:Carrier domain-containing protein n=1 Tax=Deinococcus cellulosilyticus (strain DSM 18568 / NBRC 106333 / KACC 11606 / 5516J-15) TaxID=1223518 RepID=A0A511N210_DEIC1|nr:acyl carrier protein [Deinococcus cellulosilyticus]GEM46879.1 hypothetical protein DC3_25140 [Deinococcus cellulosilyticus NBRC 106333 = KACC 11606]
MTQTTETHTLQSIQHWLTEQVRQYIPQAPQDLDPETPLAMYGLDSVYALTLTGDIEDRFGILVDPTVMWDHPTLNALTVWITEQLS